MKKLFKKSSLLGVFVLITVLIVSVLSVGTGAEMASPDEYSEACKRVYTDSILDKADISLGKDDSVVRKEGKGYVALTILRAFEVEVDFSGKSFYVDCSEGTVADAIKKAGITLSGAEEVAPVLVESGIKAIWNFAHTDLDVPKDVIVENVHLSESLMQLSYNLNHRDRKIK